MLGRRSQKVGCCLGGGWVGGGWGGGGGSEGWVICGKGSQIYMGKPQGEGVEIGGGPESVPLEAGEEAVGVADGEGGEVGEADERVDGQSADGEVVELEGAQAGDGRECAEGKFRWRGGGSGLERREERERVQGREVEAAVDEGVQLGAVGVGVAGERDVGRERVCGRKQRVFSIGWREDAKGRRREQQLREGREARDDRRAAIDAGGGRRQPQVEVLQGPEPGEGARLQCLQRRVAEQERLERRGARECG